MDMSLDLLQLPGRSLLNDLLPSSQRSTGNAFLVAMSGVGRVTALVRLLSPLSAFHMCRAHTGNCRSVSGHSSAVAPWLAFPSLVCDGRSRNRVLQQSGADDA